MITIYLSLTFSIVKIDCKLHWCFSKYCLISGFLLKQSLDTLKIFIARGLYDRKVPALCFLCVLTIALR